ncbi:MAG TPA: hypothetical protein VNE62_09375 [Actinomycetota bacterium]|nr:hypothetical protein [Actinomycetota bacterium]
MRHVLQDCCRRLGVFAALSGLVAGLVLVTAPNALAGHGGSDTDPMNVEKVCPNDVNAGDQYNCTIEVTNTRPGTAGAPNQLTDIVLTDEHEPDNMVRVIQVSDDDGDNTRCAVEDPESASDTTDVTCGIATLGGSNPSTVITILFEAKPEACGDEESAAVNNTASATGTYTPFGVAARQETDTDNELIAITCAADLVLDKECENATADRGTGPEGRIRVAPGDRIRCTLTVTHREGGVAQNVVLTDNIPEIAEIDPASVESEPPSEGGFTCVVQDDPEEELRCTDPEMREGDVTTVTYEAVVGAEGVGPGRRFNNQANVTSDTRELDENDNSDRENFETPPCDRNLDARFARRGVSITGTRGNDVICGSRFGDSINALAGNDIVYGFGGNDAINGNYGNDIIFGGSGNDAIRGYFGNDNIFGESGNDALAGNAGFDRIDGGTGRDACSGESKVRC